jgi:hypothetical protein
MANPRICECVTASNGAYVCNGLGYHALGLKIHLSYEYELSFFDWE